MYNYPKLGGGEERERWRGIDVDSEVEVNRITRISSA